LNETSSKKKKMEHACLKKTMTQAMFFLEFFFKLFAGKSFLNFQKKTAKREKYVRFYDAAVDEVSEMWTPVVPKG